MKKLDDMQLTKEARYIASFMYSIYLKKRKSGQPRGEARQWGIDCSAVMPLLQGKWQYPDFVDICFELYHQNIITGHPVNTTLARIAFTNEGISMMELTFKDKIDIALDYAHKIKGLIPFI